MCLFASILGLSLLCIDASQAAAAENRPSNVVKDIFVSNGERYGTWGSIQYCANGSFAVGYDMKIEPKQGPDDDTALNGIKLICRDIKSSSTATSSVGYWGKWVGVTSCDARGGKQHFLISFTLQVEQRRPLNDDSSANYIKFKCRNSDDSNPGYELSKDPGSGFWGTYGSWSYECPKNSAICGIRTRIEKRQGSMPHQDDTALNDVLFFCCN